MAFAYHGNWCGPGWTAGQWKNAEDFTEEDYDVPAVDELDAACKDHDIAIAEARTKEDIQRANDKFFATASQLGLKAKVAAWLVQLGGPSDISGMVLISKFAPRWSSGTRTTTLIGLKT